MSDVKEEWQPWSMPALLIAVAQRLLARIVDTRFRDIGISVSQLPVLVALKDGASLSQKELTRRAGARARHHGPGQSRCFGGLRRR